MSSSASGARTGFAAIRGQDTAIATLRAAIERRRVHHAYRFEGPEGVGKEMAAFALAQALVCTEAAPLDCGTCDACRRAITFASERPTSPLHPDVSIVEKNFYPPEVIGRSRPELTEISVDQIRKIVLSRAAYSPHEARARITIVRRAEELSISAANALLKTLEEPRSGTHFVLLTARPDRLLDTIRSRTLPVRFGPLSDDIVRAILSAGGVPQGRLDLAVELASGSASAALELVDDEKSANRDAFVEAVLGALDARDLGPAIALSEAQEQVRDEVRRNLRALAAALAREARAMATGGDPSGAALAAKRYELVANSVTNLDKNASPSFTVIALVSALRSAVA
jgi:DNA polymerase III subunit delta'